MRGVMGQTVLKFPTPDAASYEESLAVARVFLRLEGPPLIVPSVAPHAPYTCPPEILHAARRWRSSSTYRCTPTWRRPARK